MTSYKNFSSIVQQTDVVQRVVDDLVIESAQILREVVKKFEETGEPIGLKRLMARPVATLSIEAQEKHERNEKIFIED